MESHQCTKNRMAFEELKSLIIEEFGPDAADDNKIENFLKARDFDVKKANAMLKKHLIWRKEKKIDTFIQDYKMPEVLKKHLPLSLLGLDKEGSPIVFVNYKNFDFEGILKCATKNDIRQFFIYFFEFCDQKAAENSTKLGRKQIPKWILIINLEGLSFSVFTKKILIEILLDYFFVFEANYPERLQTIYNINTSVYFHIGFNVIKPFLSENTLAKIKVFGTTGWQEAIMGVVDANVLLEYLDGKGTNIGGNSMSNSTDPQRNLIPKKYYMKNMNTRCLKAQPDVKCHILKRGKTLDLNIPVPVAGSFIEWDIETDDYDIAFGLFYTEYESANKKRSLIAIQRVAAHTLCETGTFKCEEPGTYILTLDNSYSVLRSKKIYYRVSVVEPNELKLEITD